jgi:hypothetical protein
MKKEIKIPEQSTKKSGINDRFSASPFLPGLNHAQCYPTSEDIKHMETIMM